MQMPPVALQLSGALCGRPWATLTSAMVLSGMPCSASQLCTHQGAGFKVRFLGCMVCTGQRCATKVQG